MSKLCPSCLHENNDTARFCESCGHSLEESSINDTTVIKDCEILSEDEYSSDTPESLDGPASSIQYVHMESDHSPSILSTAFNKVRNFLSYVLEHWNSDSPTERNAFRRKCIPFIVSFFALLAIVLVMANTCLFFHHYSKPTCTKPYVCRLCGTTKGQPLHHDYELQSYIPETCTSSGEQKYYCHRCKSINIVPIEPHAHTVNEATCTEASVCSECGNEILPALGHSIESWITDKEATCLEEGSQHGICTVCSYTDVRTLPIIEHNPGDWKVSKAATYDSKGTKVRCCTLCGQELESEEYSLSEKEKNEYLKKNCSTYTYKEIFRYPDKYKDKYAKFKGKVIQVMDGGFYTVLRVDVTKDGRYWDDTVYVEYIGTNVNGAKILEDDIIWMYGKLDGTMSYESVLGATITIPKLICYYIEFA